LILRYNGYARYEAAPECRIIVRVGAHEVTSGPLGVSIWNNFGGNVEDLIDVDAGTPVLDGTEYWEGSVGIRLATGPGNTKVFRSVNLREQFNVEDFDAMNYGNVSMDGSSNGSLFQFTITSIQTVD